MSLFCLGINHKTASVEVREKFAFTSYQISDHLKNIQKIEGVQETVIISTCNRVEIYIWVNGVNFILNKINSYLLKIYPDSKDEINNLFYNYKDRNAVNHLFEVVSGLDSMVLGETEIFGQVKRSYKKAKEEGTTSKKINKLFQQAFSVGKIVRTKTEIQKGVTSIGSVTVELSEKIFGDLKNCAVMLIGVGEISRITANSLKSRGAKSIVVSNRNFLKAQELANKLGGDAISFDNWTSYLNEVDIVITSTSAPHSIINKKDISDILLTRNRKYLFFIDIAVPRDVEDDINELENVYLYNIDQIQKIAEEGQLQRKKQIDICKKIISDFSDKKVSL